MLYSEIRQQLIDRFPPEAHRERDLPGGGTWWYIPWQTIRNRLNEVCPDDWEVSYDEPKYLDKYCYVTCTLIICGVTRRAIGSAQIELLSSKGKDMSRGNPIERAVADAFKSAAEQFQIAAYLDDQADDRTKREFAAYMQRGGNGKAVQEYQRSIGNPPPIRANPPARPFGQPDPALISKDDRSELWKTAQASGYTQQGFKALVLAFGFQSSDRITKNAHSGLLAKASDREMAEVYNSKEVA